MQWRRFLYLLQMSAFFLEAKKMKKLAKVFAFGMSALALSSLFLSCGSKTAGGKTIKIGVFEPMTGANAAGGALEIEGIKLANELYPTVTVDGKEYKVELALVDKDRKSTRLNSSHQIIS